MSETPTTKKGNIFRISFSIDVEAYPQLEYIKDLKGHGRRPQELLRLALLGAAYDEAAKRLLATSSLGGAGASVAPSVNQQQAPPAIATPVQHVEETPPVRQVTETPPAYTPPSEPSPAPEPVYRPIPQAPIAPKPQEESPSSDDDSPPANLGGGFLA